MPRQKKSDSEIITNILEDGNLTSGDLQWIVNIASRKLKNRQPRQGDIPVRAPDSPEFNIRFPGEDRAKAHEKEAKYVSSKDGEAKKANGGGPVPSSSRPKNPDGDVNPSASGLRKKGEVNKKEKE